MKTKLFPFLFAASLFGSCKKDDKVPEPPKEFIQLNKIDFGEGILSFQYNDQHLISKAEILSYSEANSTPVVMAYINWTYQDGVPNKAEVFNKSGSGFKLTNEFHYKADAQKRIAYVAGGRLSENGSTQWGDTTDFTFNSNNKLVSTKDRDDGVVSLFAYDNNGNYKKENVHTREGSEIYDDKYEHQYDNNTNPFAVNGLGIMLFSIFEDDLFDTYHLFSANNPTLAKHIYLRKTVDASEQPTYTYQITTTREFTNAQDENGGLKQVTVKTTNENKENGTVTNTSSGEWILKYTCIKKQQ